MIGSPSHRRNHPQGELSSIWHPDSRDQIHKLWSLAHGFPPPFESKMHKPVATFFVGASKLNQALIELQLAYMNQRSTICWNVLDDATLMK